MVNAACLLITGAVSWVVIKLLRYEPKEDRGILMAVMTSINTGFLGFPVAKAIFGNEIFFLFVIQNINLNIYMYSLQVLQMNYGRKGGVHPKQILRAMATMPMFATILGCVLLFAGIKLPGPVSSFVGTMRDMTIPLSMVLVGVLLGKSPLLPGQLAADHPGGEADLYLRRSVPLCGADRRRGRTAASERSPGVGRRRPLHTDFPGNPAGGQHDSDAPLRRTNLIYFFFTSRPALRSPRSGWYISSSSQRV